MLYLALQMKFEKYITYLTPLLLVTKHVRLTKGCSYPLTRLYNNKKVIEARYVVLLCHDPFSKIILTTIAYTMDRISRRRSQ